MEETLNLEADIQRIRAAHQEEIDLQVQLDRCLTNQAQLRAELERLEDEANTLTKDEGRLTEELTELQKPPEKGKKKK